MICPNCGSEVEDDWKFCPVCGEPLSKRREDDVFSGMFERLEREMEEMDKGFERNFEVLDLSPFFRKPVKGGGFSIRISRSADKKPEVSFRTFGDVDRREVKKKLKEMGIAEMPEAAAPAEEREPSGGEAQGFSVEGTRKTEEPETCIRRIDGKIVAEVRLPGVKDMEDIEVKSLGNSIEIKAIAGEKAYFKILTKPSTTKVVGKKLENGVLEIEIE